MQISTKIANFMLKMLGTKGWPQARRSGQWSRWHEKSPKSVESTSSYSWSVARRTTPVLLINLNIVNQHQFPKKTGLASTKRTKSAKTACVSVKFSPFILFFHVLPRIFPCIDQETNTRGGSWYILIPLSIPCVAVGPWLSVNAFFRWRKADFWCRQWYYYLTGHKLHS